MGIVAVDIDDVCLNLVENWLSFYNEEFDDDVKKDQIVDWKIQRFIKESARKRIFKYIEHREVFLTSQPIDHALSVINWIKQNHRVVYVTANDPENCKFQWLSKHGFIEHIADLVVAYDKSLIISNILIDDRIDNVENRIGGWLFTQPWNKKYKFKNRVDNWIDVKEKIREGIIKI